MRRNQSRGRFLPKDRAAVRGDSCAAITWAFSIAPPFSRYAVIPVARNVWQHVEEGSRASIARRFTIRSTSVRLIGFGVIFRCLSTLRKSSDFLSSRIPAASRYGSRYASALWRAGTSCRLPPLGSLL
jgi:hypothetical protein